jgi:hypothetical protein
LSRIRALVAVLCIALPVPAAIAGCGGGGSSTNNEDPNQVLSQTTLSGVKSGHLNVTLNGSSQGTQSGNVSISLDGPFQSSGSAAIPQLDLTAKVSGSGAGQTINFEGSLITTKDNAYVVYQNQAYEVGAAAFQQLTQALQQAQAQSGQQKSGSLSSFFSRFGVDPKSWLTNVSNEGTTDVEGTNTIHIHGDADLSKMVSDLQKIGRASGAGATQQLSPGQLSQLQNSIKEASVDVYSGTDDHILHKAAISLTVAPQGGAASGVSSANIDLSFTLSDVNQAQTITAPSNPQPIAGLVQKLGIPGLGALGGSGAAPSIPGGAGASGGGGGPGNAYLKCLQQATTPSAVNKCAQQLQ